MYTRINMFDKTTHRYIGFSDSVGRVKLRGLPQVYSEIRFMSAPVHTLSSDDGVFYLPPGEIAYLNTGEPLGEILSHGTIRKTPDDSGGYIGPCRFTFQGTDLILDGPQLDPSIYNDDEDPYMYSRQPSLLPLHYMVGCTHHTITRKGSKRYHTCSKVTPSKQSANL